MSDPFVKDFCAASQLACLYGLLWAANKTLLFSKTSESRSERRASASSLDMAAWWEALFGGGHCYKTRLKGHVLKGWSLETGRRLWPFCRMNLGTRSGVEHGLVLVFGEGMAPGRGFLHLPLSLSAEDSELSHPKGQRGC